MSRSEVVTAQRRRTGASVAVVEGGAPGVIRPDLLQVLGFCIACPLEGVAHYKASPCPRPGGC